MDRPPEPPFASGSTLAAALADTAPPESVAGPVDEEALRDLSHILAHRLRGLVSAIEGYADLLANTLPHGDQREMTLHIFESASAIERILADLKRFSAPMRMNPGTIELGVWLEQVLVVLDPQDRQRITVETDMQQVWADDLLLRQAVLVMLQNGLDAGREVPVRLHIRAAKDRVVFEVVSAAVLPPEADAERLFEPFYTTKAQNLGVGLTLARRIARAHGGSLELMHSTPEAGTRFDLNLPKRPTEGADQ